MGRLTQVVVDCRHPADLARFWAAALDGFDILPYDDEEMARLAGLGLTPRDRHIAAPDRVAEVQRLVALGATVREEFDDHTWMLDPEGNDFCVTNPSPRGKPPPPT